MNVKLIKSEAGKPLRDKKGLYKEPATLSQGDSTLWEMENRLLNWNMLIHLPFSEPKQINYICLINCHLLKKNKKRA